MMNLEYALPSVAGPMLENRPALDALSTDLYQRLKRIAAGQMRREQGGHTLQPTALVHEAYLRLADWNGEYGAKSREHFLAYAAIAMRQLLVHHARRRNAVKRGGGQRKVMLDDAMAYARDGAPEVLAIDAGLKDLAKTEPRKARVIELRYFGGLTDQEIADVVGVSLSTVGREMRLGLALLNRLIEPRY